MEQELRKREIFKILLRIGVCTVFILLCILLSTDFNSNNLAYNKVNANGDFLLNNSSDFIYLSDINYIAESSTAGDGNKLFYDKNTYNNVITVSVEGKDKSFIKGIFAHGPSTVVYDIEKYDFDCFSAYIGVDVASRSSKQGDGVKFKIYTSTDKENWTELLNDNTSYASWTDSKYVSINIKGAKYLKLVAESGRNNWSDHAVYANAKLTKAGYVENNTPVDFIKTISEYDKIIKQNESKDLTGEYELALLQRDFVSKVGYDLLQAFVNVNDEYKETTSWLMNDAENLRLYLLGGTPDSGNYMASLKVLSDLYHNYKNDLNNTNILNNMYDSTVTYGNLYKRMMITLSLTHSTRVSLWMQPNAKENQSEALTRYQIYKDLHLASKEAQAENKSAGFRAASNLDYTHMFETLKVEEMRFVFNNAIDDEEIIWLNEYVNYTVDKNKDSAGRGQYKYITPHPYMAYVWPNYSNPIYYAEENKEYFNELFSVNGKGLFEYDITRGTNDYKLYKVWMNFRNKFGTGAVCGGISKSGSNIRATHGIPATVIGQPGHAALLHYAKDASGNGYWAIDNDVSGWTLSEKGERMLLGWGNASYTRGSYQVVYYALAQEVLNNYDTYEKSEEMNMIARTYAGNLEKQEEYYRKALNIQPLNINSWYELINIYNNSKNKTEDDYYKLAEEIAENLKYFPLPMQQLTNLIKPKLTSSKNIYRFTLLQTRILTEGSTVPNNTEGSYYVYQPGLTRLEANFLLGKLDKTVATFSFDGDEKNNIVLSSRFDGNGIRWDYSLDGKNTWKEVSFTDTEEHKHLLTDKEIASITADNDIYIHIVGVDYSENNLYKIDITEGEIPSTVYANDLENRVVGATLAMEWRMREEDKWTSYSVASPDLTGDKTVEVRVAATGTALKSNSVKYTFTADNQPTERKYIPVSHLSIESVSSQATSSSQLGQATNSIDGNYNTRWHSAWNGSDTNKYIVIKLDKSVNLTALEYVPADGGNGRILTADIYGSMDNENWTLITSANWENNMSTKSIDFKSTYVQYVKIVGTKTTTAGGGSFIAARMFNLYQDMTKNEHPTAGIAYSTTEPTNKDVVARLVNPSTKITITNNDGKDTYTFTKNGSFTFKFIDENGTEGAAIAKVNNIDKKVPTATIEYSTTKQTNKEVLAKLVNPSEEIEILNNPSNEYKDELTYIFSRNGSFTFRFSDKAGNIGTATAKVDWIVEELPMVKPTILYSTTNPTNKDVTVMITFDGNATITNNGGKDTYTFTQNGSFTFKYEDEEGRRGEVVTKVNNIDKKTPNAKLILSTKKATNSVILSLIPDEEITILSKDNWEKVDGVNKYTLTVVENGKIEVIFKDKAGNVNKKSITIDNIVKNNNSTTVTTASNNNHTTTTNSNTTNNNTIDNNKDANNKTNTDNLTEKSGSSKNILDNTPTTEDTDKESNFKSILVTIIVLIPLVAIIIYIIKRKKEF